MVRVRSLFLPAIAAIVVGAIGLALGNTRGGSTATPAPTGAIASGKAVHLAISNYAFTPPALTVRVGATITVTNSDSTAHTATSSTGAFDSGTVKSGQSARFTLNKPGTYAYICQFHAFMKGTIRVVG